MYMMVVVLRMKVVGTAATATVCIHRCMWWG